MDIFVNVKFMDRDCHKTTKLRETKISDNPTNKLLKTPCELRISEWFGHGYACRKYAAQMFGFEECTLVT